MSSEEKSPSVFGRLFGRSNKSATSPENESAKPDELLEASEQAPDKAVFDEQKANTKAEEVFEEPKTEKPDSDKPKGLFARWRSGLGKTRGSLGSAFGSLLKGKRTIDEALIEEIETLLLTADVGIETTTALIERFRAKVKKGVSADQDLMDVFKLLLVELLEAQSQPFDLGDHQPGVLMMVGVNGVGKTTTIGKLAKRFQNEGKSVMLAAGDTFRAAAVEQLQVWGERNNVPVVAQSTGADSASVIYDALESAKAKGADILIADTAGRLHNKSNLMDELSKIVRVAQKIDASAPHEVLLVLDAATGQNALNQAREFCKSVPVTGLVLTKLDGTAKGGVIFSLVEQLQLPVKFVGLGEGIDDLTEFSPKNFVDALFGSED